MTSRVYGYIRGEDERISSKVLDEKTRQFGLGLRKLERLNVECLPIPDTPEEDDAVFELTTSPNADTADLLLDPSDWSPYADIPVSWRVSERLHILILWVESLFDDPTTSEVILVISDHDIEDVRRVGHRAFRKICLADFASYTPPNNLYVISRASEKPDRFVTEKRSICSLYWGIKQGERISGEDLEWLVTRLKQRPGRRKTEQALLAIGMANAAEYRGIVESYLDDNDLFLVLVAFRVLWTQWKNYERYQRQAIELLRRPIDRDETIEFKQAIIRELASYILSSEDSEMIQEVFGIYLESNSPALQWSAYEVLRELIAVEDGERESKTDRREVDAWVVEKIADYVGDLGS